MIEVVVGVNDAVAMPLNVSADGGVIVTSLELNVTNVPSGMHPAPPVLLSVKSAVIVAGLPTIGVAGLTNVCSDVQGMVYVVPRL